MKPEAPEIPRPAMHTELLLLPDGRILTHNLTPMLAAFLQELSPNDPALTARLGLAAPREVSAARPLKTENCKPKTSDVLRH
jgi:hypothetical protein